MNVTIRLATPADADDMARVVMRSWDVAYKDIVPDDVLREKNATRPAQYKRIITEENTTYYVIQTDGKTVGIMCVAPTQDDDLSDSVYELQVLYLHPDYYRKGLGAQAMAFAFDIARGLGKTAMTLWVLTENTNAIRFYEKCGFTADGRIGAHNMGKTTECIKKCIRMRAGL